jgi:hypothetical protein
LALFSNERTAGGQEFDRAAWLAGDARTRRAMADELLRGNELLGKSRRAVIRLLGQPDGWTLHSPGGCQLRYRLGPGQGGDELHIYLNQDDDVQEAKLESRA